MPTLTFVSPGSEISSRATGSRAPRSALALMIVTVLSAGVWLAPSALADPVANLKDALAQARAGTPCGSLHPNPIAEQAATKLNQLTADWLDHKGTQIPPEDALPGLKILGYPGNKATRLQGAGSIEANAIKGALLEGYKRIPDCGYTDYGASMIFNVRRGEYLSAVVMAGA